MWYMSRVTANNLLIGKNFLHIFLLTDIIPQFFLFVNLNPVNNVSYNLL